MIDIKPEDPTGILGTIPGWLQVCDVDGTVEWGNPATAALTGWANAEMVGQKLPSPWFPDGWNNAGPDPFEGVLRNGPNAEFETQCRASS